MPLSQRPPGTHFMCADWGLLAHTAGLGLAGRCLSRRELERVRKGRRLTLSELRGAGEVGPYSALDTAGLPG